MGSPYSQDLRDRVFAIVDDGSGVTATARLLRVSVSWVSKVLALRRDTGRTSALPRGPGPKAKLADHHAVLRARVAAVPDETLKELRAWLLAEHGVSISPGPLCTTLRALGPTRKKRRSTPANRTGPMSPGRARPGARRSRNWTPVG